jgi:autotransporter-associated beta strand protein
LAGSGLSNNVGIYAGNISLYGTLELNSFLPFNQTLSGIISGTGGMIVDTESYQPLLSGANTFNGTITIGRYGFLQIGGAGFLGSGNYSGNISNSGALEYGSSSAQTISGVMGGTGGLYKDTASSTLTLTGANTYTGATNLIFGTLALGFGAVSSNILSPSSPLNLQGGVLQLTGAGTQTVNSLTTYSGTGSTILLGASDTLILGALTSQPGSGLNLNTSAGGANATTSTVGTSIVVLTGQTAGNVINTGFTVTDTGGSAWPP